MKKKNECDFFTCSSSVHFRHLTHLLLIELEQKIINADIKDDHAMNDISTLLQKGRDLANEDKAKTILAFIQLPLSPIYCHTETSSSIETLDQNDFPVSLWK